MSEKKSKKEGELPFLELSDKDVHWKEKCYALFAENVELRRRVELPEVETRQTHRQRRSVFNRSNLPERL
jgi:hypothetical protein